MVSEAVYSNRPMNDDARRPKTIGHVILERMRELKLHSYRELQEHARARNIIPLDKNTISRLTRDLGTPERSTLDRVAVMLDWKNADDIHERMRKSTIALIGDTARDSAYGRRATDSPLDPRLVDLVRQLGAYEQAILVLDLARRLSEVDDPRGIVDLAFQIAAVPGHARLAIQASLVSYQTFLEQLGHPRDATR